ncbi:DUF4062 domain-containing protein [Luteolibacter soli]|uniref:DUF4062 domain-containing protein n=1 Tax=Luteolibacter soli TaxID=3135280 RepID=A0ABU9AU92_9BACT
MNLPHFEFIIGQPPPHPMAIPRVFVSSTYYDLRHIRKGIELFIDNLGYDSILFESGDIPFSHEQPLDISCYKEIGTSHMLVLIIGGRSGSKSSDSTETPEPEVVAEQYRHYNSITQRELETALQEDIPVYIFVERGVAAEYLTYKENRENDTIRYAHVDNIHIFKLLDFIYSRARNNLTKDFEHLEDITSWLRSQWAGLLGDFLTKRSKESSFQTLRHQLKDLHRITETLKGYSENIMRGVSRAEAEEIIIESTAKLRDSAIQEAIKDNRVGKHLVSDHGADPTVIAKIISEAENSLDLVRKFRAYPNTKRCSYIHSALSHQSGVEEINLLRSMLGVPLLEVLPESRRYRETAPPATAGPSQSSKANTRNGESGGEAKPANG